jgi:hypothetical protein
MGDKLRSELLTPSVDEEVELDEDGSPDVIRAEAEVSVPVVRFNYGVYEAVSFGDCVVRFERERGLEDSGAEARLVWTGGGKEGGWGDWSRSDCWRERFGRQGGGRKCYGHGCYGQGIK